MSATVTGTIAPVQALTANDRCDRCGAQAYTRFELVSGGELHFCAHHSREHGEALKALSAVVTDETHRLAPPVAPVVTDAD